MQLKWTLKYILKDKIYLEATYQLIHTNLQILPTCIAIVGRFSFLCLELSFGTTPSPEEYTTISTVAIDLRSYLLMDISWSWDPSELQSPHSHLLPKDKYLPDFMPLVPVYTLKVNIESQ